MEEVQTKRCPHCETVRPLEAFARRRGNGRASYCRGCLRVYQRGRPRLQTAKRLVQTLKDGKPCADCGNIFPHYVLDYDHRQGTQKKANLAVLTKRGAKTEVLLAEIAKCDLVCANCHRRRTWARRTGLTKRERLLRG